MQVDIEKIASLARLRIEPEGLPKFQQKMQDIINMVENLPEISSEAIGVDPSNPMKLREDEIRPSLKRSDVLMNAPKIEAGCVVVPKTVD